MCIFFFYPKVSGNTSDNSEQEDGNCFKGRNKRYPSALLYSGPFDVIVYSERALALNSRGNSQLAKTQIENIHLAEQKNNRSTNRHGCFCNYDSRFTLNEFDRSMSPTSLTCVP